MFELSVTHVARVIQMCSSVEIKAVWEKVAQDSGRPLMILEKLLAPDIRATGQGETLSLLCCDSLL